MFFTLEALKAKHGDSLLLHYGDDDAPRLIVIDGGPAGVYRRELAPRLEAIRQARAERAGDPLTIRILMVSHIDDDHIRGVLDLAKELREAKQERSALRWKVEDLWHNSFDDLVGPKAGEIEAAAVAEVGAASLTGDLAAVPGMHRDGAVILASVPQGRTLRNDARFLEWQVNGGADLIRAQVAGEDPVDLDDGLTFRVLGPAGDQIDALQEEWDRELERRGLAADEEEAGAAAYVDGSVFNLASLVVLAEAGGKSMLLTGDARGDHVLAGAEAAGLLDDEPLHVDLLKVPHHGSDRNLEVDFFERITADHYVISGDGRHHNPELDTFRMLHAARGNAPYEVHLTYPFGELRAGYPADELQQLLADQQAAGARFEVVAPPAGQGERLQIDLLEPYSD